MDQFHRVFNYSDNPPDGDLFGHIEFAHREGWSRVEMILYTGDGILRIIEIHEYLTENKKTDPVLKEIAKAKYEFLCKNIFSKRCTEWIAPPCRYIPSTISFRCSRQQLSVRDSKLVDFMQPHDTVRIHVHGWSVAEEIHPIPKEVEE